MKPHVFFLLCIAAGIPAAPAADILSESFAFGPGIPGRRNIKAGDYFFEGAVQSGSGEKWSGPKMNFHKESAKYVAGGGIQLVPGERKENFSFFTVIDPAKLGGGKKSLTATVDFIPGTLWGKNSQGAGITGLWIGLHGDGAPGLMAGMKTIPIVAARVGFEEDNTKARLLIYVFEQGKFRTVHGELFPLDVRSLLRFALRISPEDHSVECTLTELGTGNCTLLDTDLVAFPDVNILQVDLTSLRTITTEIPPEIKRVSLKSEG